MELFRSNVIGVVERGRYTDQNWKNTSLAFAISHPPSLSSIHSTLLSGSDQSPPLFPSISLCLPDHFTLLSTSSPPSGLYLCLVFSFQPFHFSHHLLHFYPFNTQSFSIHSSSIQSPLSSIPFSYGWWGPERVGSVSSHGPRPPPRSRGRKTPQSPSSPLWRNKTHSKGIINEHRDVRLQSVEKMRRSFKDSERQMTSFTNLHISNICCGNQRIVCKFHWSKSNKLGDLNSVKDLTF